MFWTLFGGVLEGDRLAMYHRARVYVCVCGWCDVQKDRSMVVRLACIDDDDVLACSAGRAGEKVHTCLRCVPGLAVRSVEESSSHKSLSEIQIDARCGCEDEGCMRKDLAGLVPAIWYTIGLGTLDPEDEYRKERNNRYKMVCSVRCFKTLRLHQYGSRKERDGWKP